MRDDGSSGTLGAVEQLADINLASNPFYSEFTDSFPLSAEAQSLPNMHGAGMVRDLREAASLPNLQGSALATQLTAFAAESTRSGQLAMLDTLLKTWADTSTMTTTANAADAGVNLNVSFAGVTNGTPAWQAWIDKLSTLEQFNGQTFSPIPASGGTLSIDFFAARETLLDVSYSALKESVYGALVMQTRLKPYLDQISLSTSESGVAMDFSAMEAEMDARYATDSENAVTDLIELTKYVAPQLSQSGWQCAAKLTQWISAAESNGTWEGLRTNMGVSYTGAATAANDFHLMSLASTSFDAGAGNDTVIGSSGNDTIYGVGGEDFLVSGVGDDTLVGSSGSDTLMGGGGNDVLYAYDVNPQYYNRETVANTLNGGKGNDTLHGSGGSDTYLYNLGDGADTIYETTAYNVADTAVDRIVLDAGIAPADVTMGRSGNDLLLKFATAGDQITLKNWYSSSA